MCMNKSCSTGGKILLSLLFSNLLLLGLLLPKFSSEKENFFSFLRPSLKISIRKKELFYKTIHAKTVVVLYRVISREFLRPAKLPVSSTERISVSRVTIAYMSFKNNALLYEMQKEKPIAPRIWSLFLSSYFSL